MQENSESIGKEEVRQEGADRPPEEYDSLEYNRLNSRKYKGARELWSDFLAGKITSAELERHCSELLGEDIKSPQVEKLKDMFEAKDIW